jgi:hypothetical protein
VALAAPRDARRRLADVSHVLRHRPDVDGADAARFAPPVVVIQRRGSSSRGVLGFRYRSSLPSR